MKLALAVVMQRAISTNTGNWFHWVVIAIAVIIGGGLLVWALKTTIDNFVPEPYRARLTAFMYIVIALCLATLVFHWAGLI